MAEVVLEDVVKTFPNGSTAVDHVDLQVADCEFVVLVGPSGCGKSTTLRLIAGLEEITSGSIRIGGRLVNHLPPKDRDVAMVFQDYALYPHMTVYENMAFSLKLRRAGRRAIDEQVLAAARMLNIEALLERRPKALSGGQRQRVAIGRAIVRDPQCFLFDEPLSNLDAQLRSAMRAEIKKLHRRIKTTTLYVTHDQEEAMTLGDRVVVLKDGLVQQCGPPLEIYQSPVNRFVARFLGQPAMNFLEGKLLGRDGRVWFYEGSGFIRLPDWASEALEGRVGQPVTLGVRPDAIGLSPRQEGDRETASLEVSVELAETLGDRTDLYLSTPSHPHIVARISGGSPVQPGSRQAVYLDLERAHFFEPGEMGANLSQSLRGEAP